MVLSNQPSSSVPTCDKGSRAECGEAGEAGSSVLCGIWPLVWCVTVLDKERSSLPGEVMPLDEFGLAEGLVSRGALVAGTPRLLAFSPCLFTHLLSAECSTRYCPQWTPLSGYAPEGGFVEQCRDSVGR